MSKDETVDNLIADIKSIKYSDLPYETLSHLEKKVIARDSSSKFPEEILDLPTVGSAYTPNIEMIIPILFSCYNKENNSNLLVSESLFILDNHN